MSMAEVTPVHAPLGALLEVTQVGAPLSALLGKRTAGPPAPRAVGSSQIAAMARASAPLPLPVGLAPAARSARAQVPPLVTPSPSQPLAPALPPPPIPPVAPLARPATVPAAPPGSAPAAPVALPAAPVALPAAPVALPAAAAAVSPAAAPSAAPYALGGLAIAMIGSIGFSGKAIIVKIAYRYGVDAVTLIMYRMLVALVPFLVIALWAGRGKPPLTWRDRASIFALGLTGYYLASFLDFLGLQYISASLERLILYLNPTLVFLFGLLWFGQKATRRQVVAIATGYAGMLVVFGSEASFAGSNVALGTALVFAGAISYALYISYSGALVSRLGSLRLVGWASTVACLLCFAQFLVLRPISAALVPAPVVWLSLINGTACTVAPVLLLMIAINRVGSTAAAQASLLGPISTIAMSVFILDEPFTAWVAVGTVLVLGSIWLLARKPRELRANG